MIEKIKFKWYFLWILSLLLIALGKSYEYVYPSFSHSHGQIVQKQANSNINSLYKDLDAFDQKFIQILTKKNLEKTQVVNRIIDYFSDKKPNYFFILCQDNSLIFWNKPGVYYSPNWCPCSEESIGQGIFLQNGVYYYGLKNKFESDENTFCYILYKELLQENVQNEHVSISKNKTKSTHLALVDNSQSPIAYMNHLGNFLAPVFANFIIFFYLLALFIFYFPFHHFAKKFFSEENFQWALLTLIFGVFLTVSMSQWIVHQHDFYHSILTNSKITTSFYNYTLFEFLILSLIIFHLAYFFHKYYHFPKTKGSDSIVSKYLIPLFNYLAVFLSLIVFCSTSKAIFVHSDFYFDLGNVIAMPIQNYLLLFSLLLILLSIFLISNKLCLSTFSFSLNIKERLYTFFASAILITPLLHIINLEINIISFLLGASILIWLQDYFSDEYQTHVLWLISWILLISFLSSGIIFHYQNINKRHDELSLLKEYIQESKNIKTDSLSDFSPIALTINSANEKGIDFYFFEDGILKYASNIQRPNYKDCTSQLKRDTITRAILNNKDALISKPQQNQILVFAHPPENLINGISLFSYLFTLLIILSYVIYLIQQRIPFLPEDIQLKIPDKPSLRNRIQFYVILGIVLSFLVIAVVTIFFTKKSEQSILEETLYNKIKSIGYYLEVSIANQKSEEDALLILKNQLQSGIQLFDYPVEFFDQKGLNINYTPSTLSSLDNKIKLCDPRFYFNYTKDVEDVIIQPIYENFNELRYAAFKNIFLNNQRIGTIQISTLENSMTRRNDSNRLAVLFNTLLNIYVFLFLIAASLATLLANSITSPLEVLANKLKQIRLGKRNETLEWSVHDEIGELIQDYNTMVTQLDESAVLLAKSERDSAWREMAKQVAHEIKNPLTPMKLNIQYMQQSLRSGETDKLGPMVERVSITLLEQIDGLTKIATEFSNFAKMPQAENNKIMLNDVISSVHDLFRKREDIDVFLSVPINELWVYQDKNQIIRVLNNLINNAIQAIPENIKGRIEIILEEKDRNALISIKDNGIGIPVEMIDKVFLPNFTTKSSGTGLGLAMCQQIIETSNGRIYFKPNSPTGTIFFVEIPLMKNTGSIE